MTHAAMSRGEVDGGFVAALLFRIKMSRRRKAPSMPVQTYTVTSPAVGVRQVQSSARAP